MSVRFANFAFDAGLRQLTRDGVAVPLSPKATDLLRILLEQRPRAVPKQELMDRLWPDVVVEEANIRNLASDLRQALGDDAQQARMIRTVSRFGYAFCADAREDAPEDGGAKSPCYMLVSNGQRFPILRNESVIGRDPRCSVTIDLPSISRTHARISITSDTVILEDLGSKNGTWLAGTRLEGPVVVHEGDVFELGSVEVTLWRHEVATVTERGRSRERSSD